MATFIILGSRETFASFVTIINPSFEDPGLSPSGYSSSIPGWTVGNAGVWNPWSFEFSNIPDGTQVGYDNVGTVSQTLTTELLPNTTYTLSISVGGRADGSNPGTDYAIGLYGGANLLASVTPVRPPTGSWTDLTTTFTSGAIVTPGTLLGISISNLNPPGSPFDTQLDFDNVSLTATPVPEPTTIISGSLMLLPFGASTLRILRRRVPTTPTTI